MARAEALGCGALALATLSCGPSLVDLSRGMAAAHAAEQAREPVRERERIYHDRARTQLATEGEVLVFPDGYRLKQGIERAWFEDGTLRYERGYDQGEPTGLWRAWHRNGSLQFEHLYGSEEATEMSWWHAVGRLSSRGLAQDGLRIGPWTFWYASGIRSSAGSYRRGVRHGEWRFWHADGSLHEVGEYRDGLRIGQWLRFLPGERPDAAARQDPGTDDS